MIVMLALLNDGAILSIAYDNVRIEISPKSWDMRTVLSDRHRSRARRRRRGIWPVLSGRARVSHRPAATPDHDVSAASVAGHLTIFQTRTRGPCWSIRPARILWIAVLGTQTLATLIAVYGFARDAAVVGLGAVVWGYALAWFLVNDRLKLLTYWILDSRKLRATPKREVETARPLVGAAKA